MHNQQENILNAAVAYARRDLKIIPLCSGDHLGMKEDHRKRCANPGKAPLLGNWINKASDHPEEVSGWFNKYKTANIGAITGTRGGIVAIDVDGDYGRIRLQKLSGGEIPLTWEFTTPGLGHRYLFAAPPGPPLRKFTDARSDAEHQELAFLGDGQQTVLPPSIHRNGIAYEWVEGRSPEDIDLAPAPDWMLMHMSSQYTADALFDDFEGTETDTPTSPTASTSTSTSTSTLTTASTSTTVFSPSAMSPKSSRSEKGRRLEHMMNQCREIKEAVQLQKSGGCDEETWFRIVSLLSALGAYDEALAFSRLSDKHNQRSEERIAQIRANAGRGAFGPARCTTFNCDAGQIKACFGSVATDSAGTPTNSPARFYRQDDPSLLEQVEKLLQRTRYQLQHGRLVEPAYNKNGEVSGFNAVGNFIAIPLRNVEVDNGVDVYRELELEGVLLRDGRRLRSLTVRQDEFPEMKWISQWGIDANLEPGAISKDKMRHAIQQLAFHAGSTRVYGHLGFRQIDGHWRYLHAGGCLGEPEVTVEVDRRLSRYALPEEADDLKAAVRHSLSLLEVATPDVTTLLLALVYLAPLCEALRTSGIEPSFVVWLYGQTGTRKSTLAALFLSHFGRFSPKGAPASFKDTANSLERRGFDTKDSVLWIDDFHPSSNPVEARKMEQIAQSLLRSYGDRVGRGRMRADASLRPDYPPRGLVIATGEMLPDGHSSNARMQSAEVRTGSVDLDKLTAAQGEQHLLGQAMTGYVRRIGERMSDPDFLSRLAHTFEARRALAQPTQTHGRLAEATAWLYLGLESMLEFAVEVGAATAEELRERLDKGWQTLLSLSNEQSEQVDGSRPARQFLSIVAGMLQSGSLSVRPTGRTELEAYKDIPPRIVCFEST
ncbi:bifunctional DNA primase/polymerase [Cohnella fermenti]|uniref:Bifunctional DNA primase/polymerase n=1 Tax=Cohnella fermenti TaxID=2565925 RepID=A0A4S4BEX1_9BACL|nr:bifunctional DNA primase/polymerase [Cohnella fermenti]THF72485.1 bifunctional DNA primase/polymerase [Cohnella fermenti]